ncbi:MAG: Spy/CpxP family protein refolding chaperone [Armatimonadota bacterium]
MKKGWLVLIALLAVLAGTSYGASRLLLQVRAGVLAGEPGLAMLQSYVGLTPDQRSRLADIDMQFARTRSVLRQRVWDARDRFLAAVRDPESSDEEIAAALRRFVRAREEMAVNTISYIVEVRRYLTPAQRDKLISVVERGVCGPCMGSDAGCDRPGGGACGMGALGALGRGRHVTGR